MKIINLGRGQGKTTRLLYASEFNNMPILCSSLHEKQLLIAKANEYDLKIPEPITVNDVISNKLRGNKSIDNGVLVDEAPIVFQSLLTSLGVRGGIKAIAFTEEQNRDFKR
jgi:hypothetical protein